MAQLGEFHYMVESQGSVEDGEFRLGELRAIVEPHSSVEDEEALLESFDESCQQIFFSVKRFFEEKVHREPHHGYHHAVRVLAWTQQIARDSFSADALIVAMLHDVLDHKFHDVTQEDFDALLDQLIGVGAARREHICKAIVAVSFSKEKEKGMRWYEEHLGQDEHWIDVRNFVSDADKLEALGVVGAARCFACAEMFATRTGAPQDVESIMQNVVDHCHQKLFLLGKDYFRTPTGMRLAAEKTEELKRVLVDHGVNPHSLDAEHRIIPDSAVEVIEAFLTDSDPAEFVEIGQKGTIATVDEGWSLIDFEDIEKLQWVRPDALRRCVTVRTQVVEPHHRARTSQGMQTFAASVLEGNADETSKHLMRCDKIMYPTLWYAPVPEWMIEEEVQIKDLWMDRVEHEWSGLSGDEVFYVMIKHADKHTVRYLVESPQDIRRLINGLEWATHEKARVESQDFPFHGYFVNLKALQLCVGSGCKLQRGMDANGSPNSEVTAQGEMTFTRMYLDFHLPLFDVLPSANTAFRKGDVIYGGCREVSYRDITIHERSEFALLKRSLDDQNKLRCPLKVKCLRQNAMLEDVHIEEEVQMHPDFRFLGHRTGRGSAEEGHDLHPDLALNKRLVFEVEPSQMVLRNFPNVQFEDCRLDYDFFRVKHLPRSFELGERGNPISRYSMRTNILGIARLRQLNKEDAQGLALTDQEKHYVYDVDWFPKRTSKVQNGDVLFLPRLPAETAPGVSQRFWNDEDIKMYAHEFPSVDSRNDPARCNICMDKVKDCVLDPCGCKLCYACLEKHRTEQLTRNVPIACPFCRDPIRAVIRHART